MYEPLIFAWQEAGFYGSVFRTIICSLHLRNMDTRHTPACKFSVLGGKKIFLFKKIILILHMFLTIFIVVNLLLFWNHQINVKNMPNIYTYIHACEGWTTPTREQWWRMCAGFLFLVYWRMWRIASSGFWKHLINNRGLHGKDKAAVEWVQFH